MGRPAVMRPAERELREELSPLVRAGAVEVLPHEGWLTTGEIFARSAPKGPPWRMDAFYRLARRESGVLMTRDGKPSGGKFSFDVENRERWEGRPPAPDPPRFEDDPVKTEVLELVETRFARHPGRLDGASLATTAADARILWSWALRECLPRFGPFEDAMSLRSRWLFHTRISPLLNLHRLLPRKDPPEPIVKAGQIVMHGAGSKSVRTAIEKYQPMLGLHGHIHESMSVSKIGRTTIINPGSEYGEGVLRGCLVNFSDGAIEGYQMTSG